MRYLYITSLTAAAPLHTCMQIFSKYDRENKGGLAWKDIQEMVYSNMNIMDPTGWCVGTRLVHGNSS